MKCSICRNGETMRGEVSVMLEREQTTVIVKGVPADICRNCGEYWLEEKVAGRLLRQAEDAAARRAEVEIVRYAA